MPIAFGADSVASALHLRHERDPATDQARLPRPRRGLIKSGTFYFARKGNFLSGLDTPIHPNSIVVNAK